MLLPVRREALKPGKEVMRTMSSNQFSGLSPHIEKLARTLMENGLAASATDAISLAQSISDDEGSSASEAYGSEKIPNRHPERPKKSPVGIANLHPSEHGPPLSHLDKERKPGRIENVPEPKEQPAERPKPKSTPAVFLHEPEVSAASVQEAASEEPEQPAQPEEPAQPEQREEPKGTFDITDDEEAVRKILEEDDRLIYGEPEVIKEVEPAPEPKEEEPVIQPAEPAPVKQPEPAPQAQPLQRAAPQPMHQDGRGRGLTKEEHETTDITRIFNFSNR